MENRKNIAARGISIDVLDVILNTYDSVSSGIKTILEAWKYVRSNTLDELKGIFTEDELLDLVYIFKKIPTEIKHLCKKEFVIHIVKGRLDEYRGQVDWNIDEDKFINKLDTLTSAQCFILIERIRQYWTSGQKGEEEEALKQLNQELL